ncbi:uncharacterized protein TRIREDRAFT_105391 [Trichoderma reesei QM6a]|uniref:Predicted protein n=2 Tax=Hypocrea jecorina TaxID=51453 RepID=G0REA1_HYPJQ|nr:uncharacterized protein TRIREDRAFT_105391 [Trichoderma reesei QM6a]EGR50355.1 predicted protein [Trichoderma reesei QM6a]ETS03752.1 hypothetical protein M419DRAFT_128166 [Trichoderma reesei RUT C-30]
MFDPADLELIRGISLTYELEIVHASFNVMCRSLDLPLICGSLHDFEPRQLRLLACTLFNGLLSALPENSRLRASLSVLASSMLPSSDALGSDAMDRIILLIETAIHSPNTMLVWDLVLREISLLTGFAPSQPIDPRSTAKDGGSEQRIKRIREHVQRETFKEIQGCTFLGVGGFFEKFFEGKDWTEDVRKVYGLLKKQHVNNMWAFFRASPSISEMMRWLDFLQDHILKVQHRNFWEVNLPSELTEGITGGRLDLCVKGKPEEPPLTTSEWEDILVIGQLTTEGALKKRLVQLACYARHLFDYQPTRRYLHAFTICGSMLEPWVFDRSGCYSPGAFNIHQHPERFIRVMAGYIMMSGDDLGLDTFVQREGRSRFIDVVGPEGDKKKLYLSPALLDHRPTIVSCATSCFLGKHADSNAHDHVIKFSWPQYHEKNEAAILQLAQERGVQGIVRLVTHSEITTINEMRRGMTFGRCCNFDDTASVMPRPSQPLLASQPLTSKSTGTSESSTSESKKRGSTEGVLNRQRLEDNSQLPGQKKELTLKGKRGINRDIISQWFWQHRIFRCVEMDKGPVKARNRVGTKEFMAIRALRSIEHTYRQDLESFFYVLLWQLIARGWDFVGRKNPVVLSELHGWLAASSFEHLARNKQANMDKHCFESVLAEFPVEFERLKPFCRTLRSILFPMKDGAMFTGTPFDSNTLYGEILEAFDEIIAKGQRD